VEAKVLQVHLANIP